MSDTVASPAPTGGAPVVHEAAGCPQCFEEMQTDSTWWRARPAGSRLVGLVVTRDDMPSVVEQREDLTRFGVPIGGFRHPAPETLESWEHRLTRFFGTLVHGDVLVISSVHALGRDLAEERRTIDELQRRGIVIKVLAHGARHLAAAP
ncbi:recombinase family protein [Microbacterium gorillae]|uniref:recombinase family protein n=1 Tax=Microbacterium gorillae TaxID=1231063 RepID=UPI00059167E0|nr:dehydrogenase [Microbacterium gorillae]